MSIVIYWDNLAIVIIGCLVMLGALYSLKFICEWLELREGGGA